MSVRRSRSKRSRGAEVLEFTFILLPFVAMLFVLLDTTWALFSKATLQRAVRLGVRTGVTLTGAQMAQGSCLTGTVKSIVQQNSLGILRGVNGMSKIKVHYYDTTATDVSGDSDGNQPGNIMQVSVEGFSLMPLIPRIFSWRQGPDNDPTVMSLYSADLIEPSKDPPCIGSAP